MSDVAVSQAAAGWVRALNVSAKVGLLLMLAAALRDPDVANLRDKAAGLRAITYPVLSFALPVLWLLFRRERGEFPWGADLLITVTCFTDILGNRMDLYDSIRWFDDWVHFANTGLLAAAFIQLTLVSTATLAATVERGLAFGVTAAVGWEIAEYFAFLRASSELPHAYADTLGDLALGMLGAVLASVAVHALRRRNRLDRPPALRSRPASGSERPPLR